MHLVVALITFLRRGGPAAVLALMAGLSPACVPAATLTVACASVGVELAACRKHAGQWAAKTGHTVKIFTLPNSSTDMLALLRQMFAARSADLDVLIVDVVWPGLFKEHLLDLRPYTHGAEREHFPAIVANNTVDGRLLAMPGFVDAGLLYYRKDLLDTYGLKPPETWAEFTRAAETIQRGERAAGQGDFHGYVFQGKAYEGLTCNALEWVASFGGGEVVDEKGDITIGNAAAVQALATAGRWVGTIAPRGVLNYAEEDARGVFQSGKAAFMRNWPYAWALSQAADSPVRGKVGVAPLPQGVGTGARHVATLGGWQYAVSRYSTQPALAADLVMHMSSRDVQKDRALNGSFNPTMPALYDDPDILAANPFMGRLREVFENARPRPSTATATKYPRVSQVFWNTAHDVLSGRMEADDAVRRLEARLKQVKRRGW